MGSMPDNTDHDLLLSSLLDDLRARVNALNELYHPVYGGAGSRTNELERVVEELRAAIRARRAELAHAS